MAGLGETLRSAREARGLSYKEVEDAIKIRSYYLQALEAETFAEMPGEAYTKGFIRTYAKFLRLDDDALMAAYLQIHMPQEPAVVLETLSPIQTMPTLFRPRILLVTALVAVALVVGISLYFRQGTQPEAYVPPPLATEPEVAPEPVLPEVVEPLPEVYDGLVVEVAFSGHCWLSVNVDNAPAFVGFKDTGDVLRLEAQESVEFISIGASETMAVQRNGVELPPLTEHVARNYRITLEEESLGGQTLRVLQRVP